MLTIRLQRIGRRNDPAFRVIVTESARGPKSGKNVELLGSYNPRGHSSQLKEERIKYWISQGAQVSPTVHNLLINEKIIEGTKINVLPRKSPVVKEKQAEKEKAEGASDTAPEQAAPTEEATAAEEADVATEAEEEAKAKPERAAEDDSTKQKKAKPSEDKESSQEVTQQTPGAPERAAQDKDAGAGSKEQKADTKEKS